MGGYVKMDKDLRDDDRVAALTDQLLEYWVSQGVPPTATDALRSNARNAVIGGLYSLWRHADTYLQRDDRLGGALRHLSDVTGLPVTLLKNFPRKWLVEHPDGSFELPGYSAKNSLLNKDERREGARERQARFRQRKRDERNASRVTQRNAAERDTRVTTGTGTGTGTETLPTIPNKNPSQPFPLSGKGRRARGDNPRALGTNPRVNGANPRAIRDASLEAWRKATAAIDRVKGTPGTWADVSGVLQDPIADRAIERAGGHKLIADRDRFTANRLQGTFREVYEDLLEREGVECMPPVHEGKSVEQPQ